MIGLDTNVVVRFVVRDDEHQTALADSVFDALTARARGFVSLLVAVETWWVLRMTYRLAADRCLAIVSGLIDANEIAVEREELVREALAMASRGADFADALIATVGRASGCTEVVTFDRRAARSAGMRLLEP